MRLAKVLKKLELPKLPKGRKFGNPHGSSNFLNFLNFLNKRKKIKISQEKISYIKHFINVCLFNNKLYLIISINRRFIKKNKLNFLAKKNIFFRIPRKFRKLGSCYSNKGFQLPVLKTYRKLAL